MCGVDVVYVCDDCGRASPVDVAFCAGCGARLTTLRQKDAAARPALTGARRVTTVLMTDLSGFTAMGERHDPEDVAELMTTIRDEGARIIESYGGTVNQFIGDEIVAVFGIPAAADDDARRAVLAAMDLHDRIDELNQTSEIARTSPLAMHSGLQTGLLVVGSRDERNGRYELTGDTINTAARLLNIADRGEVVVGDKTRELVAPYFDVESKDDDSPYRSQ